MAMEPDDEWTRIDVCPVPWASEIPGQSQSISWVEGPAETQAADATAKQALFNLGKQLPSESAQFVGV